MGGLSCAIPHNAIMAGANLPSHSGNPTDPAYVSECIGFDAKVRKVYSQSDVVAGIVDADLAMTVCPILAKSTWTPEERETLWNAIKSLWPSVWGW